MLSTGAVLDSREPAERFNLDRRLLRLDQSFERREAKRSPDLAEVDALLVERGLSAADGKARFVVGHLSFHVDASVSRSAGIAPREPASVVPTCLRA